MTMTSFGANTDDEIVVPRIPTIGQVRAHFRQLADIDLKELEARFIRAIERNTAGGDFARDGFPSGRPGSGGMDAGTSTESAGLSGYHVDGPVDAGIGRWLSDVERSDEVEQNLIFAGDRLWSAVADLNAVTQRMKRDEHLATYSPAYDPSGSCAACDRWVAGTSTDRLRSGYCDACRKAWERAGRPDRAQFERERGAQTTDPRR